MHTSEDRFQSLVKKKDPCTKTQISTLINAYIHVFVCDWQRAIQFEVGDSLFFFPSEKKLWQNYQNRVGVFLSTYMYMTDTLSWQAKLNYGGGELPPCPPPPPSHLVLPLIYNQLHCGKGVKFGCCVVPVQGCVWVWGAFQHAQGVLLQGWWGTNLRLLRPDRFPSGAPDCTHWYPGESHKSPLGLYPVSLLPYLSISRGRI